jgi:hypothetical protein
MTLEVLDNPANLVAHGMTGRNYLSLTPRQRRYRSRRGVPQLAAINRSLRVHGDAVPSTWPTATTAPIEALPV